MQSHEQFEKFLCSRLAIELQYLRETYGVRSFSEYLDKVKDQQISPAKPLPKKCDMTTKKVGEFITLTSEYSGDIYEAGDRLEVIGFAVQTGNEATRNYILDGQYFYQKDPILETVYKVKGTVIWPEECLSEDCKPLTLF